MANFWEEQISLNPHDSPEFELLPPPGALQDRTNWGVSLETLNLAKPLEQYIAEDPHPLPLPEDREGYYGERHFEYWLSGLEMFAHTSSLRDQYGAGRGCYAELGAASGRVIRHMAAQKAFDELWAFDLNWRHTCWINRYLPRTIRAIHNSSIPSLPLPDGSVDCFSAMSVFSHIETFELQWLAEIRRILKPDGLALITVVTDHQIRVMNESWPMYAAVTSHSSYGPDFLDRLARQGKIVQRWRADTSYASNVIYSRDYVRDVVGRMFDILEYREEFPNYQDCLVLRRN